jgi:ryanodine receptor 2
MISGVVGDTGKSDMPSGLVPNHKQSMALFLERVYGVEDRDLFFKLLEDAFLPDLRAATMLEKVNTKSFCSLTILQMTGNFAFLQHSKMLKKCYIA